MNISLGDKTSITLMAIPITKRQKEVLDFIKGFIRDKGYSPTLEEIRKKLQLSAVSTVHQHIDALIDKGYIKKFNNLARAIEINDFNEKRQNNFIEIPLLGMITAGEPIEAIEIPETVSIPKELNAGQGRHYALRVRGDSIQDAGIFDFDEVSNKEKLDVMMKFFDALLVELKQNINPHIGTEFSAYKLQEFFEEEVKKG
jgi:SOS regulatory protein LexA